MIFLRLKMRLTNKDFNRLAKKPRLTNPTAKKVKQAFGESEDKIQTDILTWASYVKYNDKTLADYLHHSPNGGQRNAREGAKFKRMGVKRGYPDLILDIARQGYHGLRIELKTAKGRASTEQKQRLEMLNAENYKAVLCFGYDEAVNTLKDYMSIKKNERYQWECDL